MNQIVLELDNDDDLALLLMLARRLDIKVVAVKPSPRKGSKSSDRKDKIARMREAASDPLFLADIEEVSEKYNS
ncbi:MAG: hypothetical protein KDD14_21220 [Saprospiraceae bacterium]|nr:hypothetical protein [Saprospiraceae bacterium]